MQGIADVETGTLVAAGQKQQYNPPQLDRKLDRHGVECVAWLQGPEWCGLNSIKKGIWGRLGRVENTWTPCGAT